MKRLVLIRHGSTSAVSGAAFPLDEPLDRESSVACAALQGVLGDGQVLCAPSLRARQTAELLGLRATLVPALDEGDFGRWRGQSLAAINDQDPAAVGMWLADPAAAPHGGESLEQVHARVKAWLDAEAAEDGETIAITSGGVIKSAVALALGAPVMATWQLHAAPLACTELRAHDGHWTVMTLNLPLHRQPRHLAPELEDDPDRLPSGLA